MIVFYNFASQRELPILFRNFTLDTGWKTQTAKEGETHRFTGDTRVAAIGDNNTHELKTGILGDITVKSVDETGKEAGKVCCMNIWVAPGVTDIDGIETDGADNSVRAEGDCIIAPEGSMVFDLTGRRVASASLRPGIYIVRTPGGKSVKIKIDW